MPFSLLPPSLRMMVQTKCHRVLTVGLHVHARRRGTYSKLWRVELILSASARWPAPCSRSSLNFKLPVGPGIKRYRVLTVWAGVQTSSALDGLQRLIHLEHLRDRRDAIGSVGAFAICIDPTELVSAQTASAKGMSKICLPLMGADSLGWSSG